MIKSTILLNLPSGKKLDLVIVDQDIFNKRERMEQQSKDKWVAALESGDYKQGRRILKSEERYCCLGVKAQIDGCIFENGSFTIWGNHYMRHLPSEYEPGLYGRTGSFNGFLLFEKRDGGNTITYNSLAYLNDSYFDFKDIAFIIKELF